MSKARETKDKIIQKAADLFNQQGYAGSSLSDVMQATGLKKGGIYNHFASKEELALAAFDFAAELTGQRYIRAIRREQGAIPRLQALINTFCSAIDELPLKGGCPLMNTAIESDDTHPALRQRAQQAMNAWQQMIHQIVQKGIQEGDIQPTTDPDAVATIMISALEGALMMTKLYGDPAHLQRMHDHLSQYVLNLRAATDSS